MDQVEGRTIRRLADECGGQDTKATAMEMAAKVAHSLPWNQCPLEEKVERLRRELLMQREAAVYVGETARAAHDLAHDHNHDPLGRVMRPANSGRNLAAMGKQVRAFDPLA